MIFASRKTFDVANIRNCSHFLQTLSSSTDLVCGLILKSLIPLHVNCELGPARTHRMAYQIKSRFSHLFEDSVGYFGKLIIATRGKSDGPIDS